MKQCLSIKMDNMYDKHRKRTKPLINRVIREAKKLHTGSQFNLLSQFIRFYFENVSYEDLVDRPVSELCSLVYSHWQLAHVRKKNEFKLNIYNPTKKKQGWQSAYTIIELSCKDMPFLIDSMRMEIDRHELMTYCLINVGGVKVTRNKKREMTSLLPFSSKVEEAESEALIHIEITKQVDPQVLESLRINLLRVLNDVHWAVSDWDNMLSQLKQATIEVSHLPTAMFDQADMSEAEAFLNWLSSNFTFLGYREYKVKEVKKEQALVLLPETGLGVLRYKKGSQLSRFYSDLPEEARRLTFSSKNILVIAKTNTKSTIHRKTSTGTDYIGVKCFNEAGEVIGEKQFIGLFTSDLYDNDPSHVPILRRKLGHILERARLSPTGYSSKYLSHILKTLPRDDLIQAEEDELFNLAMDISYIQERQCTRLFIRKDIYDRYLSCLVYVPRDRYNTRLRVQMQAVFKRLFSVAEIEFTPYFTDSALARVHFIIRLDTKEPLQYNVKAIETELAKAARSWDDDLHDHLNNHFGLEKSEVLFCKYQNAFTLAYKDTFSVDSALQDIIQIESFKQGSDIAMIFYRPKSTEPFRIHFKLFCQGEMRHLSYILPILEHMGLRVVGETPYKIDFGGTRLVWVHDFNTIYCHGEIGPVEEIKDRFQEAFRKLWYGEVENDNFNYLVLGSQLTWRQVDLLRAYAKYLHQVSFPFSQVYIENVLKDNPAIACLLVEIFEWRFDPDKPSNKRETSLTSLKKKLYSAFNAVATLDEERVLRRYLDVIEATLRTNYFQLNATEHYNPYIVFKFEPHKTPDIPLPVPTYECFVYSTRFEAVHLRNGKVARGGIRISNRQDFRTEVLGLVKAQQVKNSIIVPLGAKGGFIPKGLAPDADRETAAIYLKECYKDFMRGMLDITDNLVNGKVCKPKQVVCYDDDDFYMVVAADKGTATFSDTANEISLERHYWLGDAFASGGSAGYDHKKMGITARGAWESVKQHFFALGVDVGHTDFTVVGIGDMSGDVFGNGMLLSKHIKLVAAFNHAHIFLDPDPNPATSFKERVRLFTLPRSTWGDYNEKLISKGGGVYPRSLKSIKLSAQAKRLLGVKKSAVTPNELIRAILKMRVDLLWNGGIGTYVKASYESHQAVFDWSNDNVRVNGNELRCRVVAEGGNLGFTQLGRIEYGLAGGRINADFIDNAGGVDCSDHEVNIKILLGAIVKKGKMSIKQRNKILVSMTDTVAALVLKNDYRQNIAISLSQRLQFRHFNFYGRYLDHQKDSGSINLELEGLPDKRALTDRKVNQGQALTRSELAVLLSYSKLGLYEAILKSDLPEDRFFSKYVEKAFPDTLKKRYHKQMKSHHLYREIVATQISNNVVNDMGIIFIHQMHEEVGASVPDIIKAYVISREIFEMDEIWHDIAELEHKISSDLQLTMFEQLIRLVRSGTRWMLRNNYNDLAVKKTVEEFLPCVNQLFQALRKLMKGDEKTYFEDRLKTLLDAGVPEKLATHIASIRALYPGLNIVEIISKHRSKMDLEQVAETYFALSDKLGLNWLRDQLDGYPIDSHWSLLARSHLKTSLDRYLKELTVVVLKSGKGQSAPQNHWIEKNQAAIDIWHKVLDDIRAVENVEFNMLSVALLKLQELVLSSHV